MIHIVVIIVIYLHYMSALISFVDINLNLSLLSVMQLLKSCFMSFFRWALYPPGHVPPGVTLDVDEDDGSVHYDGPNSLQVGVLAKCLV